MNTQFSQDYRLSNSPLGREFAMYIKGQYASEVANMHTKGVTAEDVNDHEEPILERAFFYRIMRTAFHWNSRESNRNSDFISVATAYQWAALDAANFRDINRIDRNLCTHCAEIICANPSPFYEQAMRSTASDVLEIAHAAIRADKAQRRHQPVAASDGQGVLALSLPRNDQRPAPHLTSAQHSHRR